MHKLAHLCCGSLGSLHQVRAHTYTAALRDDNDDASLPAHYRAWWYVGLTDVATTAPLQLTLQRLGWPFAYQPVFSYDQQHWQPLPAEAVRMVAADQLQLRYRFAQRRVFLAQHYPYTPADLDQFLARLLADHPEVRQESLQLGPGSTPLLHLGNRSARGRIWVHARAHPGEVGASYVVEGLLQALLADRPAAAALRQRACISVVPLVAAAAAAAGNYRTNARSQNCEELWLPAGAPAEVQALQQTIARLQAAGPAFVAALNIHASNEPPQRPAFVLPHFGPSAQGYSAAEAALWQQQQRFATAVGAALAPQPWEDAALAGGRAWLQRAYPETWWWQQAGPQVMAITCETVHGRVGLGGRPMQPDDHRRLGAALAAGLAALPF